MLVVWTEMCVGSVCTQPPYDDKNRPSVFFFLSTKIFIPFSNRAICDGGPSHNCLIDSSVSAQTALVSYLRPTLSKRSSFVSTSEQN